MIQEIAAATQGTAGEVPTYLGSAMVIMYVQRAIKSREWYQAFVKAVPGADKWAHFLVAALGSLAAVGLTYKLDYDAAKGGTVVLNLPALGAALHALKDFLFTYGSQQVLYESTRKPEAVPVPTGGVE